MKETILLVDDEAVVRFTLKAILEAEGLSILEAGDGQEALRVLSEHKDTVSLVITDLKMPNLDGIGLLKALQSMHHSPSVVMITAHGDERKAVEAIKLGALDYFRKPFEASDIVRAVRRALRTAHLSAENRRLRAELALGRVMVFASPAMFKVGELVERVANKDVTVLLEGESGTGKELVAKAIVRGSKRARASFVRFNCAALHRSLAEAELFGHTRGAFTGAHADRNGLFREADKGTLLLDEINALPPMAQGLLLRVLQEKEVRPVGSSRPVPVDVRLIAATNEDLSRVDGFRRDLFYRLNVVRIRLPALRERREDIPLLARHFADLYGEQFGMGPVHIRESVMARLQDASWPGNVRQLEHTIQRMVALAQEPVLDADPFAMDEGPEDEVRMSLKVRVDAFERQIIAEHLERFDGNRSETARQLGVSRVTLLSKIKKHGLASFLASGREGGPH